jgi:hypothetical protein
MALSAFLATFGMILEIVAFFTFLYGLARCSA